ncbi:MAG: FKBP-type peptidyl-prolyl cis-trans isomerase [SAR324 cluster bacterium]|nr:FKBP-type peptidyl-prolyl cis-trans isomerase [SAR324 cluster bacterium]
MNTKLNILVLTLLGSLIIGCEQKNGETALTLSDLQSDKDKLSYSLGYTIGDSYNRQKMDVSLNIVIQGIKDGQNGASLMPPREIQQTIQNYYLNKSKDSAQTALAPQNAFNTKDLREKNLKEGQAYLESNKTKEGVVVLPNGLQYLELRQGTGESPSATDQITVHYQGQLLNGKIIDSSYQRGTPLKMRLDQGIEGWQAGLKLMKAGAKWRLFIPSALAYGEKGIGHGNMIEPNSTLIFDIELISVDKNENH